MICPVCNRPITGHYATTQGRPLHIYCWIALLRP